MGFVYRKMFLMWGPVVRSEQKWAGAGKTRSISGIQTWEDEVRIYWEAAADFLLRVRTFYYACGFLLRVRTFLLRVRLFYYGCGYFIKGTDNFMLDSM